MNQLKPPRNSTKLPKSAFSYNFISSSKYLYPTTTGIFREVPRISRTISRLVKHLENCEKNSRGTGIFQQSKHPGILTTCSRIGQARCPRAKLTTGQLRPRMIHKLHFDSGAGSSRNNLRREDYPRNQSSSRQRDTIWWLIRSAEVFTINHVVAINCSAVDAF